MKKCFMLVAFLIAILTINTATASAEISVSLIDSTGNQITSRTHSVGYELMRREYYGSTSVAWCSPGWGDPCTDDAGNITITGDMVWNGSKYVFGPSLRSGSYSMRVFYRLRSQREFAGGLGETEVSTMLDEQGISQGSAPAQFRYNGSSKVFGQLMVPDPMVRLVSSRVDPGYTELISAAGGYLQTTFKVINGTEVQKQLEVHTISYNIAKNGQRGMVSNGVLRVSVQPYSQTDVTSLATEVQSWLPDGTWVCAQNTVLDRRTRVQYGMFQRCAIKGGYGQ